MTRQTETKAASPLLKKLATGVGAVSLGAVVVPAMGIVAVFMALFAPFVLPFLWEEGLEDARHTHA